MGLQPFNSPWRDQANVDAVKKLWADGLSSSQIAAEVGQGVTRNAVIGLVHRLGLTGRARSSASQSNKFFAPKPERVKPFKLPAAPRPAPQPKYAAPKSDAVVEAEEAADIDTVEDLDIPLDQRRTLETLGARDCRWPCGDPATPEFFYCGAPAATRADGCAMPYCPGHCARAFAPATMRAPMSDEARAKLRASHRNRQLTEHARAFGGR